MGEDAAYEAILERTRRAAEQAQAARRELADELRDVTQALAAATRPAAPRAAGATR